MTKPVCIFDTSNTSCVLQRQVHNYLQPFRFCRYTQNIYFFQARFYFFFYFDSPHTKVLPIKSVRVSSVLVGPFGVKIVGLLSQIVCE